MSVRASRTGTWQRQVTDLIVAGEMAPDAVDAVLEAGLAAYAIDRSAHQNHPVASDPRLAASRLIATARHAAIRSATAALVRAWSEVGIDTLMFKGFYLAEFVYPEPSWRPYSDVDLALRSTVGLAPAELAALAAGVAADHGFHVAWHLGEPETIGSHHDPGYNGHELLLLVHEATGANVDAHRRLVHSNVSRRPQSDKGEILTRTVWDAASLAEFEGVPVYLPAPVDSALVGLIAARSWSGDRHALRPHDPLDLDMLLRHGNLDRSALVARARELGLSATARLFLRRCDPRIGRVDLRVPTAVEAFTYDLMLVTERSHRGLARLWADVAAAPGTVMDVARELPGAMRQVAALRTGGAPSRPAEAANGVDRPLDRRTWRSTQLGVRRALRLMGIAPEERRELALACLHASLIARGYAVTRHGSGEQTWLAYRSERLPTDLLERGSARATVAPAGEDPEPTGVHEDDHEARECSYAREERPHSPPERRRPGFWWRLRRIGWSGVSLRFEALLLLRRVLASLESHPFQDVRASLMPVQPTKAPPDRRAYASSDVHRGDVDRATAVGQAVASAAQYVPGALCVSQALATQVMLARRGEPSIIHFGFLRSQAGAVEGHAWLEVDGAVVIGDMGLDDFTRTATFEG